MSPSKFQRSFSLFLLIISLTNFAFGFDTAPHYDLTRSVLAERGFGENPLKIVQVENWLTDYYSSSPTISEADRKELEKLHFDNLYTPEQVKNYWGWFIDNVKTATQKAARDDNPGAMLAAIGMSLHAVQDFYTHSNWVETHPRPSGGAYRTETYLSAPPPSETHLLTGKYPEDRKIGPNGEPVPADAEIHGGYLSGLNKDSPIRPHWDEAYVFAYCASHELLEMIEKWSEETNPGFWKRVRQFEISAEDGRKLEYDLAAAQNMSMWINVKGADGHWKGDRSGLNRFFDTFSGKWIASKTSVFVKQVADDRLRPSLTGNLYSNKVSPALPKTARFSLERRAVIVRTALIKETDDVGRFEPKIDVNGSADFYSLITIGKQIYRDRVIQNSKEVINPWFEIHFVDQTVLTVPINISVRDEDDLDGDGRYKDDEIDINPIKNRRSLKFLFSLVDNRLSGDATGIHNGPETVFTSTGAKPDKDRAVIQFYVSQVPLR